MVSAADNSGSCCNFYRLENFFQTNIQPASVAAAVLYCLAHHYRLFSPSCSWRSERKFVINLDKTYEITEDLLIFEDIEEEIHREAR